MNKPEKSSSPVVSVEHLTVRYGRTTVLDDISFRLSKGSVYALLGRNGAGKTSLIRCLLGHRPAYRGQCAIFGLDCWRDRVRIMERAGIVPEVPDVPEEMKPADVVRFFGRLYPAWNENNVLDRMKRFDIPFSMPFKSLSKGQKGQLMLSLALGVDAELLILDDPTIGLDPVARKELFEEFIGELADRGTTVLIATHDLNGVEGIADQVGILDKTSLVLDEWLETLKGSYRLIRFTQPSNDDPVLDALGGQFNIVSRKTSPLGLEVVVSDYKASTPQQQLIGGEARSGRIEMSPMSLEDIFIAVAGLREERGR